MNIQELGYYQTLGKKSRLVFSEGAVRAINGLIIPPYRLSDAVGNWPAIGGKPKQAHAFSLVQKLSNLGEDGPSKKIPALSREEEALAELLLGILAYAGGRNIDLGRAAMLVHYKNCEEGT